jgi:hypothetical protein
MNNASTITQNLICRNRPPWASRICQIQYCHAKQVDDMSLIFVSFILSIRLRELLYRLSAFEPILVHLYLAKPISSACSLKVLLDMLMPYFLIRPWQAPVTLHPLESLPNFLGWLCNCFFIFSSKCFDHLYFQ